MKAAWLFALAMAPLIASPASASWLVKAQDDGAFGYDAASLSTDAEGHKLISAGLYTRDAVDLGGRMANFVVEDARIDCAGDRISVTAYYAFDDNLAPLATAPGGAWHAIEDEPLLARLKPVACEGKPLEGAIAAGERDAALRLMKSAKALTDKPADPEAERLAAVLTRHLNAHGKHFVASEAQRLAIGDASESGAKDDVREACPNPLSCLDTAKLTPDEVVAVMQLLAEQRAAQKLDDQLKQRTQAMQERNKALQRLSSELAKATDDRERSRLRSEIDKLNGDAQLDMIELQSLVTRRNQAFEMLSDLLRKQQQALNDIIGNMR